jgi:hypothetical protein
VEVRLEIVRWYDDHYPGWVECQLIDAHGKTWTIIEKVPVVTAADLDKDSAYPQPTSIKAALVAVIRDPANRVIVTIDTARPWGIAAIDGTTRFEVWQDQVVYESFAVDGGDRLSALRAWGVAYALASGASCFHAVKG